MKILKYIFIKKRMYLFINIIVLLLGILGCSYGFSLDGTWSNIIISISTAFISGALIAFLDIWRTATTDAIYEDVNEVMLKAGVSKAYKKRDLDEYDELIYNASDSIDIVGYSLRAFNQSYRDIIIEKVKSSNDFRLRIIIVDPKSDVSKNREVIEEGTLRNIFQASYDNISSWVNFGSNIEIKTINAALSSMIFRIDDIMYIGPHFYKKNSKSTITFRLQKGGWAFTAYQDEFNRMWEDGDACLTELKEPPNSVENEL